jgi:hypothetical protein
MFDKMSHGTEDTRKEVTVTHKESNENSEVEKYIRYNKKSS